MRIWIVGSLTFFLPTIDEEIVFEAVHHAKCSVGSLDGGMAGIKKYH